MKTIYYILIILSLLLAPGCRQKGLYDYSSAEATYKTFVSQAKTLRVVADHRHYRRAIRCFTKKDWKWFERNYDRIKIEKEEEVYKNLYKSKKLAYVFGRSVALQCPPLDEENYKFKELSLTEAELEVAGYPEKIKFIKTKNGWQIVGLFGVGDKV